MKKLYYHSCSYATPHMGVLINSIKNSLHRGDDVVFAYCDGIMTSCFKNPSANPACCQLCKFAYKNVIRKQLSGVALYPIRSVKGNNTLVDFEYKSISELKQITYRGVNIGLSVLSLYFTLTRNIDFPITSQHKKYFDYILKECRILTDKAFELIEELKPDCIAIYNGRYYENRVFYDIANLLGLKFESNEVVGGYNEPVRPVIFNGCLPHDVHFFSRKAKEVWRLNTLPEESKREMASAFFEKRRRGVAICDKAYVKEQNEGELPKIVANKKNIVIFNSSSDEIAAIGGEWDSKSLFNTQYAAISYILDHISSDFHVYLRIHPNLKGVDQTHHTDLYKLGEKYNNITIIAPEETISSYALLDIADKVVVFGSTMGVEACYWRKPVVLIGNAFYIDLDVCYPANNKEELISLLEENLKAKDIQGALFYSNFLLDREYRTEYLNDGIDLNPHNHKISGKHYQTYSSLSVFGSEIIFKVIEVFYRIFLKFFIKDKNKLVR